MKRLYLNGMPVLVDLNWQFLNDAEISARSKKMGGLVIRGASARQFADGDGENGLAALAAWSVGKITNGIAALPLTDDLCWICGALAGFVAPDTDRIVTYAELADVLESFEDIVPDDRYIIRLDTLATELDGEAVGFDALTVPEELLDAKELLLDDMKASPHVGGLYRRGPVGYSPILAGGAAAAVVLLVAGYFAYGWWSQEQEQALMAEQAAESQRRIVLEQQKKKTLADQYRSLHQPPNFFLAAKNVLSHFALEDSGWILQKVSINGSIQADYRRGKGTLGPFLEGKEQVKWSADGSSAILKRSLNDDLPVPLNSHALEAMDEVQAISLMQRMGDVGLPAGLLSQTPKWALAAPLYSPLHNIDIIYWKVQSPFGRLELALDMLDHPNVSIGELIFNVVGKSCMIEGLIYVPKT